MPKPELMKTPASLDRCGLRIHQDTNKGSSHFAFYAKVALTVGLVGTPTWESSSLLPWNSWSSSNAVTSSLLCGMFVGLTTAPIGPIGEARGEGEMLIGEAIDPRGDAEQVVLTGEIDGSNLPSPLFIPMIWGGAPVLGMMLL